MQVSKNNRHIPTQFIVVDKYKKAVTWNNPDTEIKDASIEVISYGVRNH